MYWSAYVFTKNYPAFKKCNPQSNPEGDACSRSRSRGAGGRAGRLFPGAPDRAHPAPALSPVMQPQARLTGSHRFIKNSVYFSPLELEVQTLNYNFRLLEITGLQLLAYD